MTPLEWELLVIDEADRLKPMGLEALRDFYDCSQMGMIFIGLPGIEKRLARHPQLYARVSVVHEFCALKPEELHEIFTQQLCLVGRERDVPLHEAFDEEALTAIIRWTNGNWSLVNQLLMRRSPRPLLKRLGLGCYGEDVSIAGSNSSKMPTKNSPGPPTETLVYTCVAYASS